MAAAAAVEMNPELKISGVLSQILAAVEAADNIKVRMKQPKCAFIAVGRGSGHLTRGIALYHAIKRAHLDVDYRIIGINEIHPIVVESYPFYPIHIDLDTLENRIEESELYQAIMAHDFDVVIVDLAWSWVRHFIHKVPGKTIMLMDQRKPNFFKQLYNNQIIEYDPSLFDEVLLIEPFQSPIPGTFHPPILLRNPEELLSREKAREALRIPDGKTSVVIAHNGIDPSEFEELASTYEYLEDDPDNLVQYSTNYGNQGIYPLVDYYNGIDLLICAAGYNQYWEARYFTMNVIFHPFPRVAESQAERVNECGSYELKENGADVLVHRLFGCGSEH